MESFELVDHKVLMTALAVVFVLFKLAIPLYTSLIGRPRKLQRMLMEQGIGGPRQVPLLGNILEISKMQPTSSAGAVKAKPGMGPIHHDYAGAIFPFLERWRNQYGELFVFGLGNWQLMYVARPDVMRDITTCTSPDFGKPSRLQRQMMPLLGQGILSSNGKVWQHQRKILGPELHLDKVKGMIGLINESASMLVESWKSLVEAGGGVAEVKVDEDMRSFSGDVIAKACFGSNYAEGEELFSKIRTLEEAMSKKALSAVMGIRCLPTKNNRLIWALEKEVKKLILELVNVRNKEVGCKPDLLQAVLDSVKNGKLSQDDADAFIVDNCKNIYLAGFESNAITAAWCLMLLATNPVWQDRVRSESLEICGGAGRLPDYDMIQKMKQLNMVIHETLRLYAPAPAISREALKDIKLDELKIPQGLSLWIPVVSLHTDPNVWGQDSYEFKPERFANGIAEACKFPQLYMPFGLGPRMCLGQQLAMTELKILLSRLLCNFSFVLSPKYVHSPTFKMILEPEFGIHLQIKKL